MRKAAVAIIAGGMVLHLHQESVHFESQNDANANVLAATPAWHFLFESGVVQSTDRSTLPAAAFPKSEKEKAARGPSRSLNLLKL